MKICTLALLLLFFCQNLLGQNVGIGTENPHSSAKLDIVSPNQGVVLPRTDTSMITNPVAGLIIYQQSDNHYYFYNGTKWTTFDDKESFWQNSSNRIFTNSDVSIGGDSKVGAGNLTVHSNSTGFGGIYSNINALNGKPFYGYAINGEPKAYHYYNDSNQEWTFYKGSTALNLDANNNFGIGTTFGLQKLHVNGAIQLGNTLNGYAGSIKWDGSDFMGHNGSSWESFTKVDSDVWEYYPTSTYENDFVYRPGNIVIGDFETFENSSTPLGFSDISKLTIASNNGIGAFWNYINGVGGKLQSNWVTESGLSTKRLAIGVKSTSGDKAHLSLFTENKLSIQLNESLHRYSAPNMIFSNNFDESNNFGINFEFEDTGEMSSRLFFKGIGSFEDYGFSFDYNETGVNNARNVPEAMLGLTSHSNSTSGEVVFLVDRTTSFMGIGENPPERHFHINSKAGEDPLRVSSGGITVLEIESNGDVGIGTTNPSDLLHIVSTGTKDPLRVQVNGTTRFRVHDNGSVSIGSNTQGAAGGLYCAGVAEKPGGGLWSIPSDLRLKENIVNYTASIEELKKIRTVSFNYKEDFSQSAVNGTHVGVIAQELQEIKPEMVTKGKDGYLRVDPNEFLYMLINATKVQQERIEKLEKELANLKDMLKS